jgi:hypothetical protein
MNKIYQYMMVAVAALAMTACSENKLDIPQRGVTGTEIYTSGGDEDVNSLIAAVYSKVHGDAFNWYSMGGNTTDCAKSMRYELARMGGELANYFKYDETSESVTYSMVWAYYYKQAYWCNMIIDNVPNNTVASETVKNRVVAEARAIRAIAMMNLVQLFGNPPLADHILTGSESNTPAAESWAFIESELQLVADQLPSKSSADGQSSIGGRLTREAVYAYLGKAYLWEKKYNEAAQTLYTNVIATNKYALEADYNALRSSSTDFSAENIWEFDFNDDPANASAQEGRFDVAAFGLSTAQIAAPDDWSQSQAWGFGAGLSAAFGQFMAKHDVTAEGKKSNRYRGTVAAYEDMLDETVYTYSGAKGVIGQVDNCQGYFNVKFQPMQADIVGGGFIYYQFSKKNLVYMRYSEVLLNYAEAVAMGGSQGAMSGLEALNQVRRRAGLADAPALDMDNADYGVKAERQAELFYEGIRFIDLVRWGDAPTVLANSGKMEYKFLGYKNGDNTTIQSPAEYNVLETPAVGVGFKAGKNELFPIPGSDINNNPSLQQNPGW